MAKDIKAKIKLQVAGGNATPALGSSLGQYGIGIMDFCKQFNAQTADKKGQTIPVIITVYTDRSFEFIVKTPPAAELIKKKINLPKGSARPHDTKVGKISWADIEDIAKVKMEDLNAVDLDQAKKIIAGSARSMGVEVVD
ncbi:50S ribosomal protein L11 [candidate division TM6 bacterium RIFCSPHIGHO2_12_FULL_36_22]|nr:MAG: 50S ribosomal protein L11 [candidate division TM6 bacterium RIFCSPHIGHO2_12_FULL_36_22]